MKALYIGGIALALGIAAFGSVWGWRAFHQCQAEQQQAASLQKDQEAIGHDARSALLDQQAQAAVDPNANGEIERLRGEVARLRKATAAPVVVPTPTPDPASVADLAPLVAKLDELNAALTVQNDNLRKALDLEHHAYLEASAAYQDERKARAASEMALQAQLAAVKASRWQGRIEGFAIGVGSGYVAGRLK